MKCKDLFDTPVLNVPCGHVACKGCQSSSKQCVQCNTQIARSVEVSVLDDLAAKHQLNAGNISSFKDADMWKLALKNNA